MPSSAMCNQLTLVTVYITFALNYIRSRKDDLGAVSRAYIERTILETIDGADFPIAYKMAYYNAVSHFSRSSLMLCLAIHPSTNLAHKILNTSQFTSFWLALQMEWGLLDRQLVRYAIDGSLVHEDLTPPDNKRHVHFGDEDDDSDDSGAGSNASDNDDSDTSASAPRASPPPRDSCSPARSAPPSDNAGAGADVSVSSAAPSGRSCRSASPAGSTSSSSSGAGATTSTPSPPPGPTPSILFTHEDIYRWTVNNGKKGPKKPESNENAGPMTKKAGVTKPVKGILKK
ncbi:MAG: hypothetical protein Q9211_004222 [Gyalolechia sp. 1 TL-2023]